MNISHHNKYDCFTKVHIDRWLWASRFYKTLALAREAVINGNIFHNGIPVMHKYKIAANDIIHIKKHHTRRTIKILKLSTRRHSKQDINSLFVELDNNITL